MGATKVDAVDALKTVDRRSIRQLLASFSLTFWTQIIIAIAIALLWLIFEPIFKFLTFLSNFVISKPGNNYLRNTNRSQGIISRQKDKKADRTYVIRYIDVEKDAISAPVLLTSSFAIDPVTAYAFPDPSARQSWKPEWFSVFTSSLTSDTFVLEWEEMQKLIGVLTFVQRKSCLFLRVIQAAKICKFLMKYSCAHPFDAANLLRQTLAMMSKGEELRKRYATNLCLIQYLGVEKGFQGGGIGSRLLEACIKHLDALKVDSYLESSNTANIPLYERFGFVVIEEFKCTPDCAPLYIMVRKYMHSIK